MLKQWPSSAKIISVIFFIAAAVLFAGSLYTSQRSKKDLARIKQEMRKELTQEITQAVMDEVQVRMAHQKQEMQRELVKRMDMIIKMVIKSKPRLLTWLTAIESAALLDRIYSPVTLKVSEGSHLKSRVVKSLFNLFTTLPIASEEVISWCDII